MLKRILAVLFLIVNLNNAPKAFNHLKDGLQSSDSYTTSKGVTYFIVWLIFFGLIYWLWKSGGKKKENNSVD